MSEPGPGVIPPAVTAETSPKHSPPATPQYPPPNANPVPRYTVPLPSAPGPQYPPPNSGKTPPGTPQNGTLKIDPATGLPEVPWHKRRVSPATRKGLIVFAIIIAAVIIVVAVLASLGLIVF